MAIKPIVKLFLANGEKGRVEMYTRPAVISVKLENDEGKLVDVPFMRCGPDEYKQFVPKPEKKEVEEKEKLIVEP